jgi:hypothetical protein
MTAVAAAPSPFTEHDVSPSNALHLSAAAFQMHATLANLPTGNCGQAGMQSVSSHHSRCGESSGVSVAASSSSSQFHSESLSKEDQSEKEGEETASTSFDGGRGCSSSSTGDVGSTQRCCGGGP